jgi:hypothetical protein
VQLLSSSAPALRYMTYLAATSAWFTLCVARVNSVETGGSWFVLAGWMHIGLQAMLRRGLLLLVLRFGVW